MRVRREPYEDRRARAPRRPRRRAEPEEPSDDDADDPRAARRRALARLRDEADDDDAAQPRDVQQTDAWRRMLAEREALARRAASSDGSEAEGMDISGDEQEEPGMTAEQEVMLNMMGFASFDSTKNKPHKAAGVESGVRKASKRKYRQYMNRKGGFNRPLSPAF